MNRIYFYTRHFKQTHISPHFSATNLISLRIHKTVQRTLSNPNFISNFTVICFNWGIGLRSMRMSPILGAKSICTNQHFKAPLHPTKPFGVICHENFPPQRDLNPKIAYNQIKLKSLDDLLRVRALKNPFFHAFMRLIYSSNPLID